MKKNNLFTLAACTCALLLSACSNEIDTAGNPDRAGADEAIVTVSLQFPQADKPSGYAPGDLGDDVLPGVSLDAEKEIKSIAFIAFTPGGTGVYLSENPTLTDNGFTKPLTPVDEAKPGEYTVAFKIKSGDFAGTTTIIAIANYKENGLTFGNDPSLDAVKKMLSVALAEEPDKDFIKYPLLMTASYADEITEGATVPITFAMERIMARVDVVNNAYDQTTKENNFVLTSARLISAPTQGMMIEGQPGVVPSGYIALKVQEDVEDILPADGQPVSPTNPAKQQLAPMYVYENSNTDKDDATKLSATATHVEVTGTYKGKAYKKTIAFKTPEKVENGEKVGGEIVPIARNTRYVVEISSGTENELVFDVKVTDWAKGDQFDVAIDFAEPVIEGLDDFTAPSGAKWDAATKTLNITHATAPVELNFTVRGFQDNDFTTATEYDENTTKMIDGIQVGRGDLGMTGYADGAADEEAPLARTYTVTIPQATGEYPSLTKIIVYNAAYADAQTEITVKYAPLFVTDIKSDQPAATIDPITNLVDLKNVSNGTTGTVSFYAASNGELNTAVTNKGITNNFYTVTTTEDETNVELTKKYGDGKRITVSYQALTEKPEFAEVKVSDADGDATTAKKIFVKSVKQPYALTTVITPNASNALLEGADKLYLAVNNADHGTIDYTVYDEASHTITLTPTATYVTELTNPNWATQVVVKENNVIESLSDYQIEKRTVKVALPTFIKNPAEVTSLKVGLANETPLKLVPVYLAGTTIAETDKVFQPVLSNTVWWAPINIGQTRITVAGMPTSAGGYIFQFGRKQPLTFLSPTIVGPVASAEDAGNSFITVDTAPNDWILTPSDQLWNAGSTGNPRKTQNDPCPMGWRVPTKNEWGVLTASDYVGGNADQNGMLTVGCDLGFSLYFQTLGSRSTNGSVSSDGTHGYYWSSSPSGTNVRTYHFNSAYIQTVTQPRANGLPVRCVQE